MYDFAIVGAGINGCTIAYELSKESKSVVVFDKDCIGCGGSGAAGAFIAPKFAKSGELKELMHNSFLYSMDFYENNFNQFFKKVDLLHIASNEKTSSMLKAYKQTTTLKLLKDNSEIKKIAKDSEYIFLKAGVVDAKNMTKKLCSYSEFIKENIVKIEKKRDFWLLNDKFRAKNIILATGAYRKIVDEDYIKIRGIWGHRIDIKTSTKNDYSIHQFVSISPSKDGIISIGATHNLNYHPQYSTDKYNFDEGRAELLENAKKTLPLEDIKIIKDYVGLRSGSVDYMPMIGKVVNSKKSYAKGINLRTKRVKYSDFEYYDNLYIINGSSGYGFVFAPYLAKKLKDFILYDKDIDKNIDIARFFAREARK